MARRPRSRRRRRIIPSDRLRKLLAVLSPNSHGSGQGIPVLPQRAHSMISCAMTPFLLKGSVLAGRPQLGITLALTGVGATRCMFAPLAVRKVKRKDLAGPAVVRHDSARPESICSP